MDVHAHTHGPLTRKGKTLMENVGMTWWPLHLRVPTKGTSVQRTGQDVSVRIMDMMYR